VSPWVHMGHHGFPWVPMGPHGSPWVPMDSHGFPWVPMETHGFPWVPMGPHGFLIMGPHGNPWGPMVTHVELLPMPGLIWQESGEVDPWGPKAAPWAKKGAQKTCSWSCN